MKIKLKEINSFKRELQVVVPWADLEVQYNSTFNKYLSNYTPPGGGRKGKVNSFQRKQFESQYTPSIDASFQEDSMNEFYKKALEKQNLTPINKAEITKLEFKSKGSDLEFIAVFEVVPSCKLPNYEKKYKISTTKYIASDEDVMMSLNELQEKFSTLEDKEKAESGFFINGDFQQLDESGLPILDKLMKNQYIKLGAANFTGDCEKNFLGSKSGDVVKTTIDINGTMTSFQVTINKIQNQVLPELDDELAKKIDPEVKSMDELKNKVSDNIQKSLDVQHEKEINNAIIDYFTKKTKIDVPTSMLDNYMEYIIQDLKQKNKDLNEEDAKKEHHALAEKNVKWYLIKAELVKTKDIKVSNDDIDKKINEFISLEKEQEKEIKEFYQKDENLNNLYEQLLNDKLFSTLSEFATNKISEKSTKELREGK